MKRFKPSFFTKLRKGKKYQTKSGMTVEIISIQGNLAVGKIQDLEVIYDIKTGESDLPHHKIIKIM